MTTAITSLRRTNRRAFGKVDATSPLLQLYCKLVAVELALKDVHGPTVFGKHHDFFIILKNADPAYPSDLLGALTPLEGALRVLRKQGVPLIPGRYPELRYLDHVNDGFVDGSTEADLMEALRQLDAVVHKLNTHWRGLATPIEAVVP